MGSKTIFFIMAFAGITAHSQIIGPAPTDPVFQYDEAGNQVFRGVPGNDVSEMRHAGDAPIREDVQATVQPKSSEDAFWSEIELYPVPVKGVLTLRWTEKADELIDSVSLYEHSTVHWKFRQKNYPQLGREMKIDMSGYYMGVYIIRFQLRDGRVMSKSIIKE